MPYKLKNLKISELPNQAHRIDCLFESEVEGEPPIEIHEAIKHDSPANLVGRAFKQLGRAIRGNHKLQPPVAPK